MTMGKEVTEKIMALVDEYPSEPLSFERRRVIDEITVLIHQYSDELDNERDTSYEMGVDDGYSQAQQEAEYEIQDLEEQVQALKEEKDAEYQRGYDDGFDAATAAEA